MGTDGSTPPGFLHMLPFHSHSSMTGTAVQVALLPWGSPAHLALVGRDADKEDESILEIGYEWPINWLRNAEPLSPFDLEWLHVQRFRADYALALGSHAFWNLREGADPPDIFLDSPAGPLGMECTRLALPERQAAHGLFRAIRQRIARVAPEHFASLAGNVVYIWFEGGGNSGLARPFAKPDNEAAADLVQALAEYRPQPAALLAHDLPDPAPQLPTYRTKAGATFYCVPMAGAVPDTPLFNFAGFEIGLAITTSHRASQEWKSLAHRIDKKDVEATDWLLISAGAPDNHGVTYPSEEALARFLLENPVALPKLKHLKRVTVHLWGSGTAVDIWPECAPVFGPLYEGAVPPHRSIFRPVADSLP